MFRRYLDQDQLWPSAGGRDIRLDEMSAAHRLSVLMMLEREFSAEPTAWFDALPLVRHLREEVTPRNPGARLTTRS